MADRRQMQEFRVIGQTSSRLAAIRSARPQVVGLTALISGASLAAAIIQHWPLWGRGLAVVLPWAPLFAAETAWMYRSYGYLALFYVLVVTQIGHLFEHVAQVTQIHVFHLAGANARGIFGTLDLEWVHFIWNTWVLVAVLLLLPRFRKNPWLWVTLGLSIWHEIEHLVVFYVYLTTGQAGTPGLLARGGLIGGGLPISRPDLHFFYNLIETVPLVIGFVWQLYRVYNDQRWEGVVPSAPASTH
jgi:hypothetical protein